MRKLGIIVFGFIREVCLENTLRSLDMQGASNVHVWLDRADSKQTHFTYLSMRCCDLVTSGFERFELHQMQKPSGIELMTLAGLKFMSERYERIIVLEDDCFPNSRAVETFSRDLTSVEEDPLLFSRYGHYYLVKAERRDKPIGRFNGWGWATTSIKIKQVLPQLEYLLLASESVYFDYVSKNMGWKTRKRLNVTPGRSAVKSIRKTRSWDGIMCLITANNGFKHQRTSERVVYNCGGEGGLGLHYQSTLRSPPFNMISENEVWDYF